VAKAHFISVAPNYYAVAIVRYLLNSAGSVTVQMILEEYAYRGEEYNEFIYRLKNGRLFDIAIETLMKDEVIAFERDDFGPPIMGLSASTHFKLSEGDWFASDLYKKVDRVGLEWFNRAMDTLAETDSTLNIIDSDYDNPEAEWSPIQIDKSAPDLNDAVERVRSDNGYAATKPGERDYVLGGLNTVK
jgi:hypothetical protein